MDTTSDGAKALGNALKGAALGVLAMLLISDVGIVTLEVSSVDVQTEVVTDPTVPRDGYPSELAAVVAASNRHNPDSIERNREHVGGILKCADGFFYTHGVGELGQAPVRFSIRIPRGCSLASLWHTHGGRFKNREYFSPADTRSAETTGKPIFMTNHTGQLRVYRPGRRRPETARRTSLRRLRRGVAVGELIRTDVGAVVRITTR